LSDNGSTNTQSTSLSVSTFYSCNSTGKDIDKEKERDKSRGQERGGERDRGERDRGERERVKRESNDSYSDLSRLENARSMDYNERTSNKDKKKDQIITPRKFVQSSSSHTDLELTDLDKDLPVIFPYGVISAILGMWLLYALLYVMLELTSRCTWSYFLVLTM
jgi:hypothetical protein